MKFLIYALLFGLISNHSYAQLASYDFPVQLKFSPTDAHLRKMKIKNITQRTYYINNETNDTTASYIDCILHYDSLSNLTSLKWNFRQEHFTYYPQPSYNNYSYSHQLPATTFSFGNTHLYLDPLDSTYYNFTEERFQWKENKLLKTETIYQKLESDVTIPEEYRFNMQIAGFLPFITLSDMPDDIFRITFNTREVKQLYEDGLLTKEELVVDDQLVKTDHYSYTVFSANNEKRSLLTKVEEMFTEYPTVTTIEYTFYE